MNYQEQIAFAKNALSSLELFAGYYASSEGFQKHKAEVAGIVERCAENLAAEGKGRFMMAFAAALREF